MNEDDAAIRQQKLLDWYTGLAARDPELYARLSARFEEVAAKAAPGGAVLESVGGAGVAPEMVLETIVQAGRPALFVLDGQIDRETPLTDAASKLMVDRIMAAKDKL